MHRTLLVQFEHRAMPGGAGPAARGQAGLPGTHSLRQLFLRLCFLRSQESCSVSKFLGSLKSRVCKFRTGMTEHQARMFAGPELHEISWVPRHIHTYSLVQWGVHGGPRILKKGRADLRPALADCPSSSKDTTLRFCSFCSSSEARRQQSGNLKMCGHFHVCVYPGALEEPGAW